jgi:hypothetical protein
MVFTSNKLLILENGGKKAKERGVLPFIVELLYSYEKEVQIAGLKVIAAISKDGINHIKIISLFSLD